MPASVATLLGLLFALIATILLYVFVLPSKKNGTLPTFLQFLHDLFLFKKLYLERILRVLYTFSTCLSIFWGFFLLFARQDYYDSSFFSSSYAESTAPMGLFYLILAPILLRMIYEGILLLILAVKNLMEINHKLTPPSDDHSSDTHEPVPTPHWRYCSQCGTRYDANKGKCPACDLN